jgi:riboflavin kinase/FMN adenylyltransferase
VVGADFHFGHRRHGTVRLLEQMGAELGFEVLGLGLVPVAEDPTGIPYSSTAVRALLADGRVGDAARLLGRPPRWHELVGTVVEGDRRGRELGFPTANLAIPERMCVPGDGIYAGFLVTDPGAASEQVRPAAISVGRRPTFYEDAPSSLVELHVLDFDGDLYGQRVAVRFVERLRGEERFETVDALVVQMRDDVERTRRVLAAL